jgi:hypothetical protein
VSLEIGKFRWRIDARREMKGIAVEPKDVAKFGCTQMSRVLQDRLEDRP